MCDINEIDYVKSPDGQWPLTMSKRPRRILVGFTTSPLDRAKHPKSRYQIISTNKPGEYYTHIGYYEFKGRVAFSTFSSYYKRNTTVRLECISSNRYFLKDLILKGKDPTPLGEWIIHTNAHPSPFKKTPPPLPTPISTERQRINEDCTRRLREYEQQCYEEKQIAIPQPVGKKRYRHPPPKPVRRVYLNNSVGGDNTKPPPVKKRKIVKIEPRHEQRWQEADLTAEDLEYEQKRAEEAADTEYNSDEEYEKLRHTEWQMAMSTYSEWTPEEIKVFNDTHKYPKWVEQEIQKFQTGKEGGEKGKEEMD